jgi:hypothetical protein
MNTPVNFETAKLLKEKDYGNKTPHKLRRDYYNHLGELNGDVTDYVKAFVNKEECRHLEPIDAPTIADVVIWCFNNYRYSIEYSMNGRYVFNGLIKGSEEYKLKVFYTSKDYPTIEKALEDTIHHFLVNFS